MAIVGARFGFKPILKPYQPVGQFVILKRVRRVTKGQKSSKEIVPEIVRVRLGTDFTKQCQCSSPVGFARRDVSELGRKLCPTFVELRLEGARAGLVDQLEHSVERGAGAPAVFVLNTGSESD